ncbi:uncharacterized protein [Palaemon carinicauda]|uniref:uncharacterized protein n=1 Tax=Palaemon carinicauda TaxID=392227 RepID=UPI0035B6053E
MVVTLTHHPEERLLPPSVWGLLAPEQIAITTSFVTYTFNYFFFGLCNAGSTFTRLMDAILGDLPFCVCYMDNILVFSSSIEEHFCHMHIVFDCLQQNGLVVRPLPISQGHRYLFAVISNSNRWPEAIPMETATSASCISALLSVWIARFGVPEHITSDRGTTFTSQLWTPLANILGITLIQTTDYNPAAKGMVEHFHLTLKAALMSRCKDSNWFTQLPWVLLGLRTTCKDALDISASEFFPSATSSDDLQRICHVMGKFTPCRQI